MAGGAGVRGAHEHGGRQPDGDRADQPQEAARLLRRGAGGLHPHRRDRGPDRTGSRPLLPRRLPVHELRRVRRDHAAGDSRARRRQLR